MHDLVILQKELVPVQKQVTDCEAEIDERVGRLYGLDSAEIKAIRAEQGKG